MPALVTRARLAQALKRHSDAAIAAGALLVALAAFFFWPAWTALERRIFDELTVATAPGAMAQPIVLIAINEESLQALNLRWPWPRTLHADLVDRMARGGAAVIALDILFAEPSPDPAEDQALAKAIARAGNVVLVADFMYSEVALARVWKRTDPLPPLLDAGALAGLGTVAFDPDQFVRRVPPEPDAFWRQIVKVLQVKAPSHPVPPLPEKGALIRFLGPDSIFEPIPYHLVLQASDEELKQVFAGRIAIVGRDLRATPELGLAQSDLFATPFLRHDGALTSGMKVHATLVDNALSGTTLRPLPIAANVAIPATMAIFAFFAFRRWRPVAGAAMLVVAGALVAAIAVYVFAQLRLWMSVATPITVGWLAFLTYGGRGYLAERQRKQEIQRAFGRYLSPDVVAEIAADPSKLALGGERRVITVMFTDLAGFTKLTESTPADVVLNVLYRHFTAMTDVIHAHRGTVVQFVGDAIVGFWGAPLEDADHALHAVEAAVEMQDAMDRLGAELKAEGRPEVRMRVGVNTAELSVGNYGSESRFYYTAMGDGMNLGSRLEGINKHYGTRILVSAATREPVGDRIPMRRVDRVRVAGKSLAVDIFTPDRDTERVRTTAEAWDAYLARDWDRAAALYGALLERDPKDGVASRLLERITAWRADPGLASEDGSVGLDKL
jgi:adenylate cyclase